MSELTLYYRPTCPFCRKVLNFIEENNIDIPLKDKEANPEYEKELVSVGGKTQVPCLVIDGKALYESDSIIEWLKKN